MSIKRYLKKNGRPKMFASIAEEFITESQDFITDQKEQEKHKQEELANLEVEKAQQVSEQVKQAFKKRKEERRKANKKLRIVSSVAVSFGLVASVLGIGSYFNSQEAQLKQKTAYLRGMRI